MSRVRGPPCLLVDKKQNGVDQKPETVLQLDYILPPKPIVLPVTQLSFEGSVPPTEYAPPEFLSRSPHELFEDLVLRILASSGFNPQRVPHTPDKGMDFMANKDGALFAGVMTQ